MSKPRKFSLFLLRISLGWMFFYAGITKILNPDWSAEGYLQGAKAFTGFYAWLLQPNILPVVNFLNEWGLTLIGACLILGLFVRLSSVLGAAMMILYYLPILEFPHVGSHSYLVDEHIIYALVFITLAVMKAGRIWGMDSLTKKFPILKRFPKLRNALG